MKLNWKIILKKDKGVVCNLWDMYDSLEKAKTEDSDEPEANAFKPNVKAAETTGSLIKTKSIGTGTMSATSKLILIKSEKKLDIFIFNSSCIGHAD